MNHFCFWHAIWERSYGLGIVTRGETSTKWCTNEWFLDFYEILSLDFDKDGLNKRSNIVILSFLSLIIWLRILWSTRFFDFCTPFCTSCTLHLSNFSVKNVIFLMCFALSQFFFIMYPCCSSIFKVERRIENVAFST